jgi:ATP-dependent protease HslVU (ClpYQ) peptidase subunit
MSIFAKTNLIDEPTEKGVIEFVVNFISWARALDNLYKLNSDFFFVIKNKVFVVCDDLFIREIKDFYAIGAGRDYTLTALHLGKDVKEAIDVACELSIYCEKPINVINIPK